jgi:3-methyladenine DNA glycosylase Tag
MVTKADAPELLDVMTRHQVFLECLKLTQGALFDEVVIQLRQDFRKLFFDIDYDDLSQLTKRELNDFIKLLRAAQIKRYNTFTAQVLLDLRKFMDVDAQMNADIMLDTQEPEPDAEKALAALLKKRGLNTMWATILAATIQANGLTTKQFLKQFTDSSLQTIENMVRRSHANKDTTKAAMLAIFGTKQSNYRDGQLLNFVPQARGLIDTLMQHTSGIVQSEVLVFYGNFYEWIAVLDSHTTDICRSRNGNIYKFGEGPLPPAHIRCRSKIMPVEPRGSVQVPTYRTWIKRQPDAVRDVVKPDSDSFAVRTGLTLREFASKLKTILAN